LPWERVLTLGDRKRASRKRAVGTREHIVAYLTDNAELFDPGGMASARLAAAVGYPGSSVAFAQLLSGMERSGLIEREVWPGHRGRFIAAAGFAAAYPVVYRMSILFHPELPFALLCALATLVVLRAQRLGWPARLGWWLGAALGAPPAPDAGAAPTVPAPDPPRQALNELAARPDSPPPAGTG